VPTTLKEELQHFHKVHFGPPLHDQVFNSSRTFIINLDTSILSEGQSS